MTDSSEVRNIVNKVSVEHKKLVDSFKEAQKALMEEFQKSAHDMFQNIFKYAPHLHMLTWTQYTPYFNDGDECYFSRNGIYAVRDSYVNSEEHEEYGDHPRPYIFEDDAIEHNMRKPSDYAFANRDRLIWYEEQVSLYEALPQEVRDEIDLVSEFVKTLEDIPEDVYQAMFGNHVAVYVTREGINVEEFEHD